MSSETGASPPKLYADLAAWWPLLSAPADYAEEAALFARILLQGGDASAPTLLELGSGGGNNASHLKARFSVALVDCARGMLEVSRVLNPQCEHVEGDMCTVRLGKQFDSVFTHDAISYMTTEADLQAAIETAFAHCRPGGIALFAPDHLRENFRAATDHGGHDADGRGLRYLEWTWDPDPDDSSYVVDYAFLLRERDGSVHVERDRHLHGLFDRADWLRLLAHAGFEAAVEPFEHSEVEPGRHVLLVGRRPL